MRAPLEFVALRWNHAGAQADAIRERFGLPVHPLLAAGEPDPGYRGCVCLQPSVSESAPEVTHTSSRGDETLPLPVVGSISSVNH